MEITNEERKALVSATILPGYIGYEYQEDEELVKSLVEKGLISHWDDRYWITDYGKNKLNLKPKLVVTQDEMTVENMVEYDKRGLAGPAERTQGVIWVCSECLITLGSCVWGSPFSIEDVEAQYMIYATKPKEDKCPNFHCEAPSSKFQGMAIGYTGYVVPDPDGETIPLD